MQKQGIKALNSGRKIIEYCYFGNCQSSAVNIIGQTKDGLESIPLPRITSCVIYNPLDDPADYGISIVNFGNISISYNGIINTNFGIYLSLSHGYLVDNYIISNSYTAPGIFMVSSGGDIRGNEIMNHSDGISLGNSSPNIGQNYIHDNKYHGIYIGSGSNPYMVGQLAGNPPVEYAISGYNSISNNGGYLLPGIVENNDGSEIYINGATVQINNGCNSISDNRIPVTNPNPGDLVNTQILMGGKLSGGRELKAENNFWDAHTLYPLSTRFGSLKVDYTPYSSSPCSIEGEDFLFVKNSVGEVVDTVYSTGEEPVSPSVIETAYALAEEKFISGDYADARINYETIISGEDSVYDKLKAYDRIYKIGKLTGEDEEYFLNLQSMYNSAISSANDSLTNKILQQNILLSEVSKGEYLTAITGFDNIVQQDPESEEAFYAEIDIITTSLLADTNNTQLGKIGNGKYLVKSSSDYMNKLNSILMKHYGIVEEDNKENVVPTEYFLFQNYPNPFNPITAIKYSLPEATDISLVVYDILGREVKILVDEKKEAGNYETTFDASSLPSGVYIYRMITKNFTKSQKMVLVK